MDSDDVHSDDIDSELETSHLHWHYPLREGTKEVVGQKERNDVFVFLQREWMIEIHSSCN